MRAERNGFAPASRRTVFSNFDGLSVSKSPFQNLPESGKGRWGEGLAAEEHVAMPLAEAATRRGRSTIGRSSYGSAGVFFCLQLTPELTPNPIQRPVDDAC
jgi:hypothetical protein